LSNIQRYSRINVEALHPGQLFPDPTVLAPDQNTSFLRRCLKQFRTLNFAEQSTGRMYLRIEAGAVAWIDRVAFGAALIDADTLAGVREVASAALGNGVCETQAPQFLQARELPPTLGEWGRSPSNT